MEVHFSAEQQSQLARIASRAGTVPERLVTTVVARYLDEEAQFLAAVDRGIEAGERGKSLEEGEIGASLDALTRFSGKIPALPIESFSRESFYRDHD